jgi:hypothetical protein
MMNNGTIMATHTDQLNTITIHGSVLMSATVCTCGAVQSNTNNNMSIQQSQYVDGAGTTGKLAKCFLPVLQNESDVIYSFF